MTRTTKIVLASVAWFMLIGVVILFALIGSVVSIYNTSATHEVNLEAQYQDNQNVLANYYNKVNELIQVPEQYKNDYKEIIESAVKGTYGEGGSKAIFQFLQERQINYDNSLNVKMMQVIESGRNDFKNSQTTLIDKRRTYQVYLADLYTGFVAKLMGFPKVDLKRYDPVINDKTEKAFETKRDEGLDLKRK